MKITTIINYCTYNQKFINHCIDSLRNVSDKVIVTYTTHFYDGTPENYDLINETKKLHTDVEFLEIKYDSMMSDEKWCKHTRIVAMTHVDVDTDYLFLADSDEILIVDRFLKFLTSDRFVYGKDYRLLSYWYFRDVKYQSKQHETSLYFLNFSTVKKTETKGLDRNSLVGSPTIVASYDSNPLAHHFSWVLTKENMIKKVSTWGHKNDRNWLQLVEKEFSREFNGTDFVHGYQYNILESPPI